jgi:ABC-type glycerol-3-phosphate transport system permease component
MARRRLMHVARHLALMAACAVALVPLVWGLVTSLKDDDKVFAYPPEWIPSPVTFSHYKDVLVGSSLPHFFVNSTIVTALTILITLGLAMHMAYAAARIQFRGKNALLFVLLASSMIPGIAILTPLYLLSVKSGLYDTHAGLVLVYSAWQVPTVVWLLRGFIANIPVELEEAAMLDGCSRLRAFYLITLPALQPGLAAAAVLVFVAVWNDFLIATALTISEDMRLIQVGLYRYIADVGVEWGRFLAYGLLALAPILLAFVFLQRRFISGLTMGAVKG